MGLNNDNHENGNKIYLNIVGGKITRRVKEHLPEENGKQVTFSREIKDKDGNVIKTVIERRYKSIDGLVTNAIIDITGAYGAMLVFTIMSDEEYTLSVPLDSSYGRAVMKRIPNIDPNKEMEFKPFNFNHETEMKNGEPKKIVGCNLFQKDCDWKDDKVLPKWTKEEPGSLPQWKKSETTGKWDNTEELEFLGAHFLQWASKIGGINTESSVIDKVKEGFDAVEDPDALALEKQYAEEQAAKTEAPAPVEPPVQNDGEFQDLPF